MFESSPVAGVVRGIVARIRSRRDRRTELRQKQYDESFAPRDNR